MKNFNDRFSPMASLATGAIAGSAASFEDHELPETLLPAPLPFDYEKAFSRNLGWVTAAEQRTLHHKKIAIAGMGGVGGSHLLTATRLGIGAFNIADFDDFDLPNFNRQAGANINTLGQPKTATMTTMAKAINPEVDITTFPEGVNADNIGAFLDGVDLYIDGLDFFVMPTRRLVFQECARRRIPAITAGPLGMSFAAVCFVPGGMTFEEYFQLEGVPEQEQLIRFLVGLSPKMPHRQYLADPSVVDFVAHRVPSMPMACELCAGVAVTQALKILLNRGSVPAAPHSLQFDAYKNRLIKSWRPGGNKNPLQKITIAIVRWQLARIAEKRKLMQA